MGIRTLETCLACHPGDCTRITGKPECAGINRHVVGDARALQEDAIPSLQRERGRPSHRPDCVLGDRGYDAEAIRRGLRVRHIIPFLAKRNTRTWQRAGAMALGGRTDLRLVESVPAAARALRKAGRHSRGILVPGVCSDLLALPASRLGGGLKVSFARNALTG